MHDNINKSCNKYTGPQSKTRIDEISLLWLFRGC